MQQQKEDNQSVVEDLEQLKQKVKLSTNLQRLQLCPYQAKFVQKLVQLNLKAKELITQDLVEQPLVYLAEAERVLEYGASCGKTIDRNIIVCTLHNQACCYYKASDLVTASRYIEAVIFNIKSHLDSVDSSPNHSCASDHQRGKRTDDLLFVAVQKKIELVQYYLKYCTINSQAKNRIVALDASKRVIQVLKSLLNDIGQNQKIIVAEENEVEYNDLKSLVRKIKVFKEELALTEIENYVILAKMAIKKWNQNKVVKKINFNLQKHISNYSISQVIDMTPIQYSGQSQDISALNSRSILRQILHFSMGYFTISTQYRLISEQLYKKQEERTKSEQYLKSNIYHLLSILFLALHVNCDLLFMKQIISSYEHHFKTLLLTDQQFDMTVEELLQRLLFDKPLDSLKGINNSLANKIKKLRSKSKDKRIHSQYEDTELHQSKACYKMNESKDVSKSKKERSKAKVISQAKKQNKILNESLFDSIKNKANKIVKTQERSISVANNKEPAKKRSVSKEVQQPIKIVKSPQKQNQKQASKKTNDEYQLSSSKFPVRKRTHSISSVDLSCTTRQIKKTKLSGREKSQPKNVAKKKKVESKSKQKVLKDNKQTYSKHYYV